MVTKKVIVELRRHQTQEYQKSPQEVNQTIKEKEDTKYLFIVAHVGPNLEFS